MGESAGDVCPDPAASSRPAPGEVAPSPNVERLAALHGLDRSPLEVSEGLSMTGSTDATCFIRSSVAASPSNIPTTALPRVTWDSAVFASELR